MQNCNQSVQRFFLLENIHLYASMITVCALSIERSIYVSDSKNCFTSNIYRFGENVK